MPAVPAYFPAPAGWPGPGHAHPAAGGPPPAGRRRWERMAVTALVFAFGFFPVGLILGIVALSRVAVSGERGRGLAVGAIGVAGAQILALAVFVPYTVLDDDPRGDRASVAPARPETAEREPEDGGAGGTEISVFELTAGDCFSTDVERDESDEDATSFVTLLACEDPHGSEVFAAFDVDEYDDFGAEYPGEEAVFRVADEGCMDVLPSYVLDVWEIPLEVTWSYYYPEERGWGYGDREVLCFFGRTDGAELTGGSLRGREDEMSPRALRYLEVTGPLDALITREPLPEDPVAVRAEWAGEMADTVAREADALTAVAWHGELSRLVDELVAARQDSLEHWRAAADGTTAADVDLRVETGYTTLGVEIEYEIRALLDLAIG
ncbi:DUF4190 domain-containing protein [Streptomyces hainanensis]|uniref:DUF4190 domain-containing protein n=1 Tax=Streptomyces hainanensis TaxID=402648 RepID=UPI001404D73B|nr:DUF4190 domain-containing protein [Streptomyces hainanensis]